MEAHGEVLFESIKFLTRYSIFCFLLCFIPKLYHLSPAETKKEWNYKKITMVMNIFSPKWKEISSIYIDKR